MRTLLRLAAAVSLSAFAYPALAGDEIVGPPSATEVGCQADTPWTQSEVARMLKVEEAIIRRIHRRYGLGPAAVCTLEPKEFEKFRGWARDPKRMYDQPDKAMEFRLLSLIDESGAVRPNGMSIALQDRLNNLNATRGKSLQSKAAGITSASWTALGPGDVGGRVRAISPDPAVANRILAGSVSGGIWKTTDAGANWTPVADFMANVAIACLVRDPNASATIYACTGEGAFNVDSVRGLGLFKSTDNGETWSQVASTNPATGGTQWYYVNRLAINPANSLVMLAATNSGVYRTINGGTSWTDVYGDIGVPPLRRRVYDVKFNPTGSVAVLGEHRYQDSFTPTLAGAAIAHSVDGGASWTRVTLVANPLPNNGTSHGRVELVNSPSVPANWYASVDYDTDTSVAPPAGQIYKSTNNGVSWTLQSNAGHLGAQGWYDNTIWVAPNDDLRVIAGGVSMYMSLNGGTAFTQMAQNVHVDHHALVSHPNYAANGIVYNGNDGGIYRFDAVNAVVTPSASSPATTELNNGLAITQFYGGAGGSIPAMRIAGGTQDNGSYVYNGTTWQFVFGGDGGEGQVDTTDSNYSYGELQYLAVHRNSTGGSSGSTYICAGIADSGCPGAAGPVNTNFIAPIALDPSDPNRLYAGSARLWRTSNAKEAVAANVAWSEIRAAGTRLSFIAVAPSNPSVIWVGDNSGNVFRTLNGLNASPTWSANLMSPAISRQVLRILIDPSDAARVFVAYGGFSANNVQLTTNGLDASPTWTSRSGSGGTALPQAPVRSLARHPASNLWLYAGTEVGLFNSEDGGATWSTTNDGPGTVSVEEIFFLSPTSMVVSTHGRGMFQATVTPPASSPGILQYTTSSATLTEGGSTPFNVSRSGGSSGAVSVRVDTVPGTATNADFTPIVNLVLNWANGETTNKSFNVQTTTDVESEGAHSFTAVLSAPTGGATLGTPNVATVTITDPDQFPTSCAIPAGWVTSPGAAAGWIVANDFAFEGGCALKSSPIGNSQNARIQFTGTFSAGNITFRRRVHSEHGWDYFRFYIDGVDQGSPNCTVGASHTDCHGATAVGATATGTPPDTASGPTEWNQPAAIISRPISAGSHTVMFSYEKDSLLAQGADAAWVDLVSFPVDFTLTVTKNGTGTGVVTSSPPGINCGATCSAPFASGTGVTLTATPNGGMAFAGWSGGGCSGTGMCSVTMNAALSVMATFNTAPATPKVFDLSGDGNSDLLLRGPSGEVVSWLMNGTAIANSTLLLGTSAYQARQVADLDADNRADILLAGPGGDIVAWLMNGSSITSSVLTLGAGTGYSVDKVGDFNGDGRADLLLRHSDGTLVIWLMNGTSVTTSATVLGAGTGFSPALIGDFDGDGKSDIVLTHGDGRVTMWLMNGTVIASSANVLGAGTGYVPTHAADSNGDGRADLFYRGPADELVLWVMNGTTITSSPLLIGGGTGYRVTHTGDFNADGRADLLLRHTNGSIVLWLMNGSTLISSTLMVGATPYNATHALDFNNDGRTDVLLKGPGGEVVQWQMNGAVIQSSVLLLGATTWVVEPRP